MAPLGGLGTAIAHQSRRRISRTTISFRSIDINGIAAPGKGSGQAIARWSRSRSKSIRRALDYEWSGISLEEIQGGSLSALIFLRRHRLRVPGAGRAIRNFVDPLIVLLAFRSRCSVR